MRKLYNGLLGTILLAMVACVLPETASAQDDPAQRASPVGISHTTVNDTYMKVVYGRPYIRDRVIFGELVPLGDVWRLGANEATEITFTGDVEVDGHRLEAGTYAVFATPDEENWTIHFNSGLGQWGTYSYDGDLDVLAVEAPVQQVQEPVDPFTISFDETNGGVNLVMALDRAAVRLPINPVN